MPELPEVETTRRGIEAPLLKRCITQVTVRNARLRQPVPENLAQLAGGRVIRAVRRRGKYLLVDCDAGHLLIHLGMSGNLRLVAADVPPTKHDHLDVVLDNGLCLRYRDPRRFGLVLWTPDPARHPLLAKLGPEPLGADFTADYLTERAQGRRVAVKAFVMDSQVVVGVGNIYANESLFAAGIHPRRAAGQVSQAAYADLIVAVRAVLSAAIEQGGTTLRDFFDGEGKPGYFQQSLRVYGRAGEACVRCGTPVSREVMAQRATYFCGHCQK